MVKTIEDLKDIVKYRLNGIICSLFEKFNND